MKSLVIALFVWMAFSCSAQSDHSLLWKISGNGLEAPSYLFGTIHVKCPDDLKVSDELKKALAETDQLVLELDIDDPSFATKMQRLAVNEGMKNISSELSKEEQELLNAYLKKHYGADLTQLGILKPFTLLSMIMAKAVDCPQPASYESVLMEMVKKEEEEVLGLEELEDQFSIFDAVAIEEQLSWLVDYVKDEAALKQNVADLMAVYDSQDVDGIVEFSSSFPEFESIMDALLFERNKNWIANITAYAQEKPSLFAVGAAHLGSSKGVIALLRQAGFTVTPVPNTLN